MNKKVYITKIVINNFRTYYGENEILFDMNKLNAPIILIEAGNAAGKTTLLQAIAFGLDWNTYFDDDTEYKSRSARSFINNKAYKDGNKECSVEISFIVHPDQEKYKITRLYKEGKDISLSIKNLTENTPPDEQDILEELEQSQIIDKFFPKDSTLLRGEQLQEAIKEMFNVNTSEEIIKDKIIEMSDLEILNDIKSYMKKTRTKLQARIISAPSGRITQLNGIINAAKTRLETAKNSIDDWNNEIGKLNIEENELNKTLESNEENIKKENERMNSKVELKGKISSLETEMRFHLKYFPQLLLTKYSKDQIEESNNTISNLEKTTEQNIYTNIIKEIDNNNSFSIPNSKISLHSNSDKDLLGNWLSVNKNENKQLDLESTTISNNIKDYFSKDKYSIIYNKIDVTHEELKLKTSTYDTMDLINNSNINKSDKDTYIKIEELRNKKLTLNRYIMSATTDKKNAADSITQNKAKLVKEQVKNNQNDQIIQRISITEDVDDVIDSIRNKEASRRMDDIFAKTSSLYSRIWDGEGNEENWKIAQSRYGLELINTTTDERTLNPSDGQKEIAALAFISSTVKQSLIHSPFIGDFLFGRIDKSRVKYLSKFFPDFSHQIIFSALDNEVEQILPHFKEVGYENSLNKLYKIIQTNNTTGQSTIRNIKIE